MTIHSLRSALAVCVALLIADWVAAASLTVGSTVARSDSVVKVPVHVSTAPGERVSEVHFTITASPDVVSAISFSRAGVLQSVTPMRETVESARGSLSYSGVFPVSSFLQTENQIGTLSLTLGPQAAGVGVVTVAIDRAAVTFGGADGNALATTSNGTLQAVSGTIDVTTTTTTLTQSAGIFTAVVSPVEAVTGWVTFIDDREATLATVPLNAGQASWLASGLEQGARSLVAVYSGDDMYEASRSLSVAQQELPPFGAPTGLIATAVSAGQVNVSWNAVSGVAHYEVFRSFDGSPFLLYGTAAGNSFVDVTIGRTTYLYFVRAVAPTGLRSGFSNTDNATTIMFTNDPLPTGAVILAQHIAEVRDAVNAMRLSAGQTPSPVDPSFGTAAVIRASHITNLRDLLVNARSAMGLPPLTFTDPVIVPTETVVKAAHVQELREGVK